MADSRWIVGQVARLEATLVDAGGYPADPGVLRCRVKAPDGTITVHAYGSDPDLVRDGAGAYHFDLVLTASGAWHWRWEADAPNAGADEGQVIVARSRFA
ncbi:MAG: hypothetical protein U1E96_08720 [Azonexus sp.]